MTHSFTQRVAEFFTERQGQWIDGKSLALIGGGYGWRTRVSNCRTELGMDIENRQRRIKREDGSTFIVSEYRYVGEVFRLRA